jgi:tRNA (guanine-N7-)-methyltransferase
MFRADRSVAWAIHPVLRYQRIALFLWSMAQKKLARFEAIKTFPNVLQYPEGMAGRWNQFFKNLYPITLELACGKGEYTVGLARLYPQRNFIGVDLKGNRIFVGAQECIRESRSNAAFLRTQIDRIGTYFEKGEIQEIWITFPDPQLRPSKAKKRLTHPKFLRLYQQILAPGGLIHLKTDSPLLVRFTQIVVEMYGLTQKEFSENIYDEKNLKQELQIKTHYEKLDIAKSQKVFYLSFSMPTSPLPALDRELHQRIMHDEQALC